MQVVTNSILPYFYEFPYLIMTISSLCLLHFFRAVSILSLLFSLFPDKHFICFSFQAIKINIF